MFSFLDSALFTNIFTASRWLLEIRGSNLQCGYCRKITISVSYIKTNLEDSTDDDSNYAVNTDNEIMVKLWPEKDINLQVVNVLTDNSKMGKQHNELKDYRM
jgi:hypothetical protein